MNLTVIGVIHTAVNLLQKHLRTMLTFSLLIIVVRVAQTFIFEKLLADMIANEATAGQFSFVIPVMIAALFLIVLVWISFAFIHSVYEMLEGRPTKKISVSFRAVAKHLPTILAVIFIYSVITIGGLFLFIIPGIILMILFMFSPFEALIEGTSPITSMKASKKLVTGKILPTLLYTVIPVLLVNVVAFVATALISIPGFLIGFLSSSTLLFWIVHTPIFALDLMIILGIIPIVGIIPVIVYHYLKKYPKVTPTKTSQ